MFKVSYSMFFIGFSSGLPFLMTLTVLDVWMKSCNISNTTIGLVTFVNIPFILKFLWAPFIDKMYCPFMPKQFGKKKGWTIISQSIIIIGLITIGFLPPDKYFYYNIFTAFIIATGTSIQNMALYSFQICNAQNNAYGATASIVTFGYRIGMLVSNSGALFLASKYNWTVSYSFVAILLLMCTIIISKLPEPKEIETKERIKIKKISNIIYISKKTNTLQSIFTEYFFIPIKMFIKNSNWILIISIIALFKAGDVFAHKMSKSLYLELEFSTYDIAVVVGIFGVIATLLGGIVGGRLVQILGIKKSMVTCSILHAFANLMYLVLYLKGHDFIFFYSSVALENFSGGMMMTTFLSFLYKISSKYCPTTQYAILWGIHGLSSNLFRSLSGYCVDTFGWINFYIISFIISIPSILLILNLIKNKKITFNKNAKQKFTNMRKY